MPPNDLHRLHEILDRDCSTGLNLGEWGLLPLEIRDLKIRWSPVPNQACAPESVHEPEVSGRRGVNVNSSVSFFLFCSPMESTGVRNRGRNSSPGMVLTGEIGDLKNQGEQRTEKAVHFRADAENPGRT